MSFIPFVLQGYATAQDDSEMNLSVGYTQAVAAARLKASRGDASHGLTGIGDAGSPTQNPMQISGPLPAYAQPNVGIVNQAASVPSPHLDALNTSPVASPPYQQPNTQNPAPRSPGQTSRSNPMGL
jgi:hypothetical protein